MATATDEQKSDVSIDRAAIGPRLAAIAIGVAGIALGVVLPWISEGNCRCGLALQFLLIIGGCAIAFQGLRGRTNELGKFSGFNIAVNLVSYTITIAIMFAVILLLSLIIE